MSGDVQPRKRKDKKRKKDDLGVEEPRGTAAALGEGDVFMHSYHEHGTGGHWCAKIIFFSLLAVLLTLIGLIILENRGLSELEANSVESRYSGVLEGWLEDAPDDDHHDEHTLELKHHDEDDDHEEIVDHDDEDSHGVDEHDSGHDDEEHDDEEHDDEEHDNEEHDAEEHDDEEHDNEEHDDEKYDQEEHYYENEEDDNEQEDDQDQDLEQADDEDEDEEQSYNKYDIPDDDDEEQDDENEYEKDNEDDDETQENDDENEDQSAENEVDGDDVNRNYFDNEDVEQSRENEDEEEHEDAEEDDTEIEVEQIEKEVSDEDPISLELPVLPEDDDDDDDKQDDNDENDDEGTEDDVEDEEFLEADDELPVVERITAPAGKPFVEVEEEESSEQPPDTLEEEEEYEKKQEELRREEEQASHMWLKLVVGGALLAATHAVVRRATAPRDEPEQEERVTREETPVINRRMTLISEEPSIPVAPKKVYQESAKPIVEEVVSKVTPTLKSAPLPKQESEEEEEQEEPEEIDEEIEEIKKEDDDRELYSEEEEPEEEEEEEEIVQVKKELPKQSPPVFETKKEVPKLSAPVKLPDPEPDDEVPDDVEIIDEEQLEEELEEEDEEEEISDVDDVELLSRLEAKYGRLPEPERPGPKPKDGGNSIDDVWPGEPSDAFWRQELDSAERELRQGSWSDAVRRASAPELAGSARARYVAARALDRDAEARRDNALLSRAIAAYMHLLKMNERLSDRKLVKIASRTLDRIRFRGNYLNAEPVYRLLIRRFPNDPAYRNNLTISFLMANRADLAEESLKETLRLWPDDRVALAHYGFVLKTEHNKLEEAVQVLQKALEGDKGPACEPRFYYHLGDALLLLRRFKEAHEVHKRGAKLGHFLSPAQRSLYNVERLKSQPWWDVEKTPYTRLARSLESSWRDILKEGEAARALYEKEKEGLKERGEWSQLDLFARGREIPERCKRAPVTCSIVRAEAAAVGCRRGQIKFSAMQPGTHVRPHVGPTNCRLRMHLGLSNTKDTYIRVDQEIRQWKEGKVLMFDDSFEHEVWHNGTGQRLVLIVDVWHPDLTPAERRQLPAI